MSLCRTLNEIKAVISEFSFKVMVSLAKGRRILYTRGGRAYHHSLHYCIEHKGV